MLKKTRFIIPLLLTLPTVIFLLRSPLRVFPNPLYLNRIENSASPESTIEKFQVDLNSIIFSCILRENTGTGHNPFASFAVWLKNEDTFFDLSGYEYLTLETGGFEADKITLFIKTFKKGVSRPEKQEALTLRHNEYTLSLIPGITRYKIKLKNFQTPDWWYYLMKIPMEGAPPEDFRKVSAIDFQFIHRATSPPAEKPVSIEIRNITFHKTYPLYCLILNLITILSLPALFLRKGNKTPDFQEARVYRKLELENYADEEMTRLMAYIREHYNDQSISSRSISEATGIPREHITRGLNKEYNSTCKQLINRIRITEARRLLKTTDRRITEIAIEVGFNEISTFNRCFKQHTGTNPRQYRQESD